MKPIKPTPLRSEKGLSVAAALVFLAVAGLLIGLGLYVSYHRTKPAVPVASKTSTATNQSQSPPPAAQPSSGSSQSSNATAGTAPANQSAIKLAALGAEITVPDSIKDLTYYVATDAGGNVVVDFSTQSLTAAVPACAANQGVGAFDRLERGNGQYPGPPSGSSGGLIKQYPTYYLAYILPRGPCAQGLTPDEQNLLDDQAQDFYTALQTVQASS